MTGEYLENNLAILRDLQLQQNLKDGSDHRHSTTAGGRPGSMHGQQSSLAALRTLNCACYEEEEEKKRKEEERECI